ncbi:hypothetical protein ASPACDRAFT_43190 [Aspergillus aculeatus ATCC 16872]|uniref:Uncharacterized protein n=1 Tax=Aspergillus aculeatus (strain ATCC 16872 / CBS 172.66 / WB 5094) TaxID=690307 RepID=A0A1L9WTQ4_ASPA1|nr:uncharacterized protein ASPACDRAFT_43190 [Aspergillus aculeatus ATCC 16872]OJJ99570.1 hypothetical protein ASPACDRAFT_43190 [Aspergillus aculeatus ATCC 16872]
MQDKKELRILTPVGMLGYGFSEPLFWQAVDAGVDAIVLDSGSTDGGPSRLALGSTTFPTERYARDLAILIAACHFNRVPVIISSAGGNGEDDAVDMFVDIINQIIAEKHFRPLKVVTIKSGISKELVSQKVQADQIVPCGAAPPLQEEHLVQARLLVAQMGPEPYVKAMQEHPDFDIIIGGRSYDPAPYVAACLYHGFTDLGVIYHMGKIMECGASCATPKSPEALAVIRKEPSCFEITPLKPSARCTKNSVAAHALYENARPDILHGPGGALLLADASYEELADGRTVRVSGAQFQKSDPYMVKLEGARVSGYHGVVIGAVRDPILIHQIDYFTTEVVKAMHEKLEFDFDCRMHVYGKDGVMGALERDRSTIPKEVAIIAHLHAQTQSQTTEACKLARTYLVHGPYPYQAATGGNLAMPINPSNLTLGPACEFCVYHLMQVDDPTSHFPITAQWTPVLSEDQGQLAVHPRDSLQRKNGRKLKDRPMPPCELGSRDVFLQPPPSPGHRYLGDIASVVRSKNAGPFELTFDVLFRDLNALEKVRSTDVLNADTIARLYQIPTEEVLVCMYWPSACAFKATIKRPIVCGTFGETDTHGSQQHVPLLYLEVPWAE